MDYRIVPARSLRPADDVSVLYAWVALSVPHRWDRALSTENN